jgi:hypothetical protein
MDLIFLEGRRLQMKKSVQKRREVFNLLLKNLSETKDLYEKTDDIWDKIIDPK